MYILALIAKHLPTSMPYVLHRRPKIVSIDGVLSLQPKTQLSFWQLLVKSWLTFFFVKLAYILGFTQRKNKRNFWVMTPLFLDFDMVILKALFTKRPASQPTSQIKNVTFCWWVRLKQTTKTTTSKYKREQKRKCNI